MGLTERRGAHSLRARPLGVHPLGADASPLTVQPVETGSGAVDSAHALLDALTQLGMSDLVIAPGSRSAPLVYAAHQLGIRCHVRIDERAAAFTALGLSRAGQPQGRFAAVATTSGTAAAHLLAAAMEAHHSGVPLLLLTADRPVELRGTGANQTTIQPGLFQPFVRFSADLPAPDAHSTTPVQLRTWTDSAARAAAAARYGAPGPAHLNLGFRDPLTPGDNPTEAGRADALTLPRFTAMMRAGQGAAVSPRTIIVAGDCTDPAIGRSAGILAARTGLPIVAEPSSGARRPGLTLLTPAAVTAGLGAAVPDEVLVIGRPTLARPVIRGLLANDQIPLTVGAAGTDWVDPGRRAVRVIDHLDPLLVRVDGAPDDAFRAAWERHSTTALRAAARAASRASTLPWQARAALAVWNASGPEDTLVLGASALIRDIDQHAGPTSARIIANRGLAGIDGTIAMASGIALAQPHRASPGRVRVLLGDIAALHDLTGLVIGPRETQPALDIIVVDDGGGRIFADLEHGSASADLLERFFTTPHGTDIAAAAQALGVDAHTVTADELPAALDQPAVLDQSAALDQASPAQDTREGTSSDADADPIREAPLRRLFLVIDPANGPKTH